MLSSLIITCFIYCDIDIEVIKISAFHFITYNKSTESFSKLFWLRHSNISFAWNDGFHFVKYLLIPVEDPSENFQRVRDFVDARNCMKLSAFQRKHLLEGLSEDMIRDARIKLKLNKVTHWTTDWQVLSLSHAFLDVQCLRHAIKLNSLWPRQNGHHFPDDIFKCIFLNDMYKFRIRFQWNLFPRVQLPLSQHRFR